jgi:DNA repair protein RadC
MELLNIIPNQEEQPKDHANAPSKDDIMALAELLDDETPRERLSRACSMLEHLTLDGLFAFPWAASLKNHRLSEREVERLKAVRKLIKRSPPPSINPSSEILSCHSQVVKYLKAELGSLRNECMIIMYLNGKLRLLHEEVITNHRPNFVAVQPRQILRTAILLGASRMIVAHNHPSGDTTPSQADLSFSLELKRLANDQDMSLVCSLVIGSENITAIEI